MRELSPFKIAGVSVEPGKRQRVFLETAKLYDHTEMRVPIEVIHGKRKGPVLFVSAALHGDEINGVEVIRQLLLQKRLSKLSGTLLVIPIVNVFGYNNLSRYMPDRRDLNRAFPGASKGSLTSQLAYQFMKEVVRRSDYGIDLHTAAEHRVNLPQIRANLDDPETLALAKAFAAPVAIDARERDGSLRQAAAEEGIPLLLFEGGTAFRFRDSCTRAALRGVMRVMEHLGMISVRKQVSQKPVPRVYIADATFWIRAPMSGTLNNVAKLGDRVKAGTLVGKVCDPFGDVCGEVRTPFDGVVIGMRILPLINQGDALFNIASVSSDQLPAHIENLEQNEIELTVHSDGMI